MTIARAHEPEVPGDSVLIKLSRSTNMLSKLVFRDTNIIEVIKLLVQYRKSFDLCCEVYFRKVLVADVEREPVSRGLIQGVVGSGYRRYLRATKLLRRLLEGLRLVEKLIDETASEDSTVTRDVLDTSHLDKALLLKADEHDVLLYTEATAAHTRSRKLNAALDRSAYLLVCCLASPKGESHAQRRA